MLSRGLLDALLYALGELANANIRSSPTGFKDLEVVDLLLEVVLGGILVGGRPKGCNLLGNTPGEILVGPKALEEGLCIVPRNKRLLVIAALDLRVPGVDVGRGGEQPALALKIVDALERFDAQSVDIIVQRLALEKLRLRQHDHMVLQAVDLLTLWFDKRLSDG